MESNFNQQASTIKKARTEGKRDEKDFDGEAVFLPSSQRWREPERRGLSQRRETVRKHWRHPLLAGVLLLQREIPHTEHSEREKKSVGVSEHGISLSLLRSEPSHSRPLAPPLPSTLFLCVTVHLSPEQEADDKCDKSSQWIFILMIKSSFFFFYEIEFLKHPSHLQVY